MRLILVVEYVNVRDVTGNRNNGSYTTTTSNEMSSDGTWNYVYDNVYIDQTADAVALVGPCTNIRVPK